MVEEAAVRYRPVDLGRAVGLGPSQIRNYERLGFLPPAHRTAHGYRRFGEEHLVALRTARTMITGYGWQRACDALAAAHRGDATASLAVADERHASLHAQREQVAQALDALRRTRGRISALAGLRVYRGRTVGIGEAAAAVGTTTSAVRYWESRGVITAQRVAGRRRYDYRLLQQLQLIKLLRDIRYGFGAIAVVVRDLEESPGTKAIEALEERRAKVERASRAAAVATRALLDYLDRLGL
ncbi:MerR family transcriptional regulator [Microlunatus parietis]|uniref:DNA-binding transcriptional MerR regulator n=1 Tax=Microlunatus parietis TaxID=682979 RepID=A0A7Y9IAV4_9ACTN|nr:MerR family transcriptional regulator [Microlunatus parietis]NYE73176.1 DNA-binding transcriptional MerR regulator [Microlunatus parietis]